MPRSFSSWHGRRPDPKLFNVPNDSPPNALLGEGEHDHLDVDLQTLVDTLLGPEDSAAFSASSQPDALAVTNSLAAGTFNFPSPSPTCGLSLGQLTLQGGQAGSSSAALLSAPLPTPMEGLQAGGLNLQAGSNSEYAEYHLQRIGELQQMAAGAASGGPPGGLNLPGALPGGQPILLQRNESISSQMSNVSNESSQSQPPGSDQTPNFRWGACRNLIATDAAGVLVRQPTMWPAVQLQVQLQLPLLYWAERRRWMWHKKWTLPKLHVLVSCDGKPVGGGYMFPGEPPVYAVVSAGTLRDGSEGEGGSLHDQGLGGECQRRLVAGETTFSSLLFRHTSFNCGNRPFHLVVAVHAPAHHPLAVAALRRGEATLLPNTAADGTPGAPSQQQMVSLACSCSSPIIVDARKRTKGERPEADASDVRLVQRQRGTLAHPQKLAMQPQPAVHQGQCMPPMGAQGGYSAQPQMWQPPSGGPSFGSQGGWASPAAVAQGQISVPGAVNPAAEAAVAAAQAAAAATLAVGSEGDAPIFEACGDAVLELGDQFVVTRLLGRTAFGYDPPELVGASIMTILHASDHQPFMQTAQALLAMAAGTGEPGEAAAAPQAVRALHRVFFKRSSTAVVQVDSIITAVRSTQEGVPPKLIMASRCALPPFCSEVDKQFRVFPVGIPRANGR
jgi:hypothetical protein